MPMTINDFLDISLVVVKKYRFVLVIAVMGLIFFVYGLIVLLNSHQPSEEIVFREETSPNEKSGKKESLVVDISGAVVNPGVYTFFPDARVQDVLIKAGGLSQAADREWVEKRINLAAKITDGGKIYIPTKGENVTSQAQGLPEQESNPLNSFIDINTASQSELDSLPGVGPVTSGKIIQNRPYAAIEDLVSKKVVSSKVFDQIKAKISTF